MNKNNARRLLAGTLGLILVAGFGTPVFALSAEEELAQAALNDYDPFAKRTFSPAQFSTAQQFVGTELQLLVDISGSINSTEFDTQRMGYANAFNSTAVKSLVEFGCPGKEPLGIAVDLVYWSNSGEQQEVVGWTHLNSSASAEQFADDILNAPRPFNDLTAIGSAINFGVPLFTGNGFTSNLQIIDVSGDGVTNDPGTPESGMDNTPAARDAALAAGIDRINGLAISPIDFPGLVPYYEANVTGGAGSFVLTVPDLNDLDVFTDAVIDKIVLEICDDDVIGGEFIPIDSTALLLAAVQSPAAWITSITFAIIGVGAFLITRNPNNVRNIKVILQDYLDRF